MQSAQRDEEEPVNQDRAATMQSAQRDEEEPVNQDRAATMQSAEAAMRWGSPRLRGRAGQSGPSLLANGRVASEPLRRLCHSTLMITHPPIQADPGGHCGW
jgi:hypothetical protein